MSTKDYIFNSVIECATYYKEIFLDYEYIICSEAFNKEKFYIIRAHEKNYLHLTGVKSRVTPYVFYNKCINKTLTKEDIYLGDNDYLDRSLYHTSKRKIGALKTINKLFSADTVASEDFNKNNIHCTFILNNKKITVGFIMTNYAIPKTILKGNIDLSKSANVDLILRKEKSKEKFDEIMLGNFDVLEKYLLYINKYISKELLTLSPV